jgi:hypothetical protein
MHRIEGQKVSGAVGFTAGVVDVDDRDARPAPQGTEHLPADAAEAVDADAHGGHGAGS